MPLFRKTLADKPEQPFSTNDDVAEDVSESSAFVGRESNGGSDTCATRFRPLKRPPMARLIVLDDGRDRGRRIRLTADETTIGRHDTDIEISHDREISDSHAKIERQWKNGAYRWLLHDLDSTNGSFVRVTRCRLRVDQSFLLGARKFSLQLDYPDERHNENDIANQNGARCTSAFQAAIANPENSPVPRIVEQSATQTPLILSLNSSDCVLGRDANGCQLVIDDDPFLDLRHARFFRDRYDRWHIEDLDSVNGIWIQVRHARLGNGTQFQLGEQRFVFRCN